MTIYLIRHGESTSDVEDRFGGSYDDNLTLKGKKQALILSKKLKNIKKIYSSPLKRAYQTAQILSKELQVKVEIIHDLRERNRYGIMTGMKKENARKQHPKEYAKLEKDKIYSKIKQAEPYTDFKKRIISTLNKLRKEQNIAIITHGGVIMTYYREILGKEVKPKDCQVFEI